jgi:hypothetical protein
MQTFTPTTDRQIQLVEDIKRMFLRQKEMNKIIQFSERDQDYFSTNLQVLMDRLKEETKMDLMIVDAGNGEVRFEEVEQFAEGEEEHIHGMFSNPDPEVKPEHFHALVRMHGGKHIGQEGHFSIPKTRHKEFKKNAALFGIHHGDHYKFHK